MPKFNNDDNFIMIIKLNSDMIRTNRLVAYFLSAPRGQKSYAFKNKFKYKVIDEMLFAKAKSSKLMLFKENGIRMNIKKSKNTHLQFRHFSIEINQGKDNKRPTGFKKLFASFNGNPKPDFDSISSLQSLYEFDAASSRQKFNKTRFNGGNPIN